MDYETSNNGDNLIELFHFFESAIVKTRMITGRRRSQLY